MRNVRVFLVSFLLTIVIAGNVSAFSLIGPTAPGTPANNDIGAPVNIGQGYRWNVPLITYAYDQSFLNFFGTNGVAAVDSAIQILNNLPPASALDPNSYPTNAGNLLPPPLFSTNAELLDLRGAALSFVLREMGLAVPERYVYVLQDSVSGGVTNYNVILRNFDPITDAPSTNLNGAARYYALATNTTTGEVRLLGQSQGLGNITAAAFADFLIANGYIDQLSYDDAGGLRYLLSTNNVALENLIPGIQGAGANAGNYVTTALRPGIDKITFQRVFIDSILGQLFPPLTNQYVDSYISNGVLYHQNLERVITQPDILFTAATFANNLNVTGSSTSNWANNAFPGNNGPGVIQPPVTITFNRLGLRFGDFYSPASGYSVVSYPPWGSFDLYTNIFGGTSYSNVVTYPVASSPAPATTFNLLLYAGPGFNGRLSQISWNLPGPAGTPYVLQYSADLSNWTNIVALTNNGWGITCMEQLFYAPQRYYRTIPQ